MSVSKVYDITIVGGGIVGLATAYKLQNKYPHLTISVLEKETSLAFHQTGRNSGVIHSGLYYKPGSFRASNCVNGRKQLVKFAEEHGIAYDVCGKIVVATHEDELTRLESIRENGIKNGLEGIEVIDTERIKEIEPFIDGIKALWVPESGIIDYKGVTMKLAELIKEINSDSDIITNCEAKHFEKEDRLSVIHTNLGVFNSRYLVFCGGLHSDRLARKDQVKLKHSFIWELGSCFLNTGALV